MLPLSHSLAYDVVYARYSAPGDSLRSATPICRWKMQWYQHWCRVIPLFAFPECIGKIIPTTNAIESLNLSLRKVTRTHRIVPSNDAACKLIYLALQNRAKKWTMPIRPDAELIMLEAATTVPSSILLEDDRATVNAREHEAKYLSYADYQEYPGRPLPLLLVVIQHEQAAALIRRCMGEVAPMIFALVVLEEDVCDPALLSRAMRTGGEA